MNSNIEETIFLSFNQIERALQLANDVVSEALCEPIDIHTEAKLNYYRSQLKEIAVIFYSMRSRRL